MNGEIFMELKDRLDSLSDAERKDAYIKFQSSKPRKYITITVLNVLFGSLGVVRFMIGDTMLGFIRLVYQILVIALAVLSEMNPYNDIIGVMSLIFVIGVWVWWFVDLFLVGIKVRKQNLRKVLLAIDSVKNQSK